MTKKSAIHLICNAHLDPVWQWEWEEGAAEALSTFRTAADFCEENDSFVFNHNEAILYKWINEHDAELFVRMQKLVKAGKWHIMGGWYLQPDCNMPSGESFVRQILIGKEYFKKYFGVEPKTATNFDSFGHTRGLVQILAKSGYNSYLFGRPQSEHLALPDDDFHWVGYDGSEILATRIRGQYNTPLGKAAESIRQRIDDNYQNQVLAILWGVGNHGGGPSRQDLFEVNEFIRKAKDIGIRHSTPEKYFSDLRKRKKRLPVYKKDLNPWAVGCYTSMIRVKQRHRLLENELYMAEKMCCAAAFQGLISYPEEQLREVLCDLMFGQFHDILSGSSIESAERASLRLLDHGLEIASRVKAKAFFALANGQKKPKQEQIPVLVYNPHPWTIKQIVECEFQLPSFDKQGRFTDVTVCQTGKRLPTQVEKESANIKIDWRKKVAFVAKLKPSQMNRFDCVCKVLPKKPKPQMKARQGRIEFRTGQLHVHVVINSRTGLVDRYQVDGRDFLSPAAFRPVVIADNEDPWGMTVTCFNKIVGKFKLASAVKAAKWTGVKVQRIGPVRVIEDGPVRSIIEVLFEYGNSYICHHYKLPKSGSEIEIETRVQWNEKNKMLKLAIPVSGNNFEYIGQVAYGMAQLPSDGIEAVSQKWVSVLSKRDDLAITCINDGIYGSDFHNNTLYLSLLRSPLYTASPVGEEIIFGQDRDIAHMDQGVHTFRFWINAGKVSERLKSIDREALSKNEKPFALAFSPSGRGTMPRPFVILSDDVTQITTIKKSENGNDLILRLFEPTGRQRYTSVYLPYFGIRKKIYLQGFEIKTLKFNIRRHKLIETDLLERPLKKKKSPCVL